MCWVMNQCPIIPAPQQCSYPMYTIQSQPQTLATSTINQNDSKTTDSFKMSIYNLVNFADMHSYTTFTMTFLCERFGFQKRRLYDVINVFESIGMCHKTTVDTVLWIGRFAIASKINKMKDKCQTASQDLIVSNEKCISISHLTTALINSFIINNSQTVDIKTVASLFSQGNNRFKTTLCKLYQIAHILEAANILCKTETPGKIALSIHVFSPDPYFNQGILDKVCLSSAVSSPIQLSSKVSSPQTMSPEPPSLNQTSPQERNINIFDVENLLNKPLPLSPRPVLLCA